MHRSSSTRDIRVEVPTQPQRPNSTLLNDQNSLSRSNSNPNIANGNMAPRSFGSSSSVINGGDPSLSSANEKSFSLPDLIQNVHFENVIWQVQNYSYITSEGINAVKTYKYNGSDMSYLYNYVLKPLAQFTVQFFPENIAPNVITLAGLLLSMSSCLIVCYFAPFFYGTAPSWVYYVCGVNAFLYQLLDNIDGQQARRTGTSSPLGELFDHGCDALNTTISALVFAGVAQMGPFLATILIISAFVTFYMATWDEYHTKELYLTYVNGADDGLTLVYILYFVTAWYGPEFWLATPFLGLRVNQIVVIIEVLATVGCSYDSLTRVESKKVDLELAMSRLVPLFFLIVETLVWVLPYNVDPSANVEPDGRTPHLYVILFTCGLVFAYIVCRIILAHVCSMNFGLQSCWVLCIPLAGAFNHLGGMFLGWGAFIDETVVTYILCSSSLIIFLHYSVAVIRDICDALNIPCFTVPNRSLGTYQRVDA